MEAGSEPAAKLMSGPRSAKERAILLAMSALYEVTNKAGEASIRPSLGLRALLAFLYLHSNGDKAPFVDFWQECQNEWSGHTQAGYLRATYTRTQWNRIATATGFDRMPSYDALLGTLAKDREKPRRGDCGWL